MRSPPSADFLTSSCNLHQSLQQIGFHHPASMHESTNEDNRRYLRTDVRSTVKKRAASTQCQFFLTGFGPMHASFSAILWQYVSSKQHSVAPRKGPATPFFVPSRWLELPTVSGQIHSKEATDACCRVPHGFRLAKKKKNDLNLIKTDVSKCRDWILREVI